jgi:hypothetical protein
VTAEFAAGHLSPPTDAPQTIAQRYLQRIQTNENLDEAWFYLDRGQAIGILRGLWRRYRKEEHERRPSHERPRLAILPLPVKEWEERLDAQGVDSMGLDEEGVRAYMAQLETTVRTWWQTVGPADMLPPQFGRLVNPKGPPTGPRWPTDSFLTLQVQLLWALERAERTFGGGVGVSDPIRTWLTGIEFKQFGGLHNRPQRAPNDEGKFSRYVSLYPPVDANPKPPEQGTHLSRQDDMAIVPDLEHLQPEEMRKMEMVLRSFWRTEARAPFEDDRFRGSPSEAARTQGFQAEELAGRISRWERTGEALGKDRTQVERAIRMRDDLWKAAFDDYGLEPPKPRTELVSRRGDTFYAVKWTPELTRPAPAPTEQPETVRPSDDVESGPQLIWTREASPGVGPFRRPQPATTQGGTEGTAPGAGEAPSVSRAQGATAPAAPPTAPTTAEGQVTVSQVLNESLAQATQQLAAALPHWTTASNGVAQLQALMQDVLARTEAQRPGITTRPIPWPSSPSDEHFPPALYVGAPGEYAVGGADPTPLLSLAEPAARAMLARRLSQLPAHTGTRLNERVRAPIFNNGAREIWVNARPLEGIAILDTGAMPLLIGRAGMAQMGWTDKDAVPNAVRLGLADGHSTNLHGLTRKTVKFEFNPGSPTKISIAVRAVVTDAPYDFLVGNIILWTIGATLDA